ncbi:MAG: PfaD family polyunsaturated fatty acid/polyketide biosynthesis protein [Pseudomonadota bacterium]
MSATTIALDEQAFHNILRNFREVCYIVEDNHTGAFTLANHQFQPNEQYQIVARLPGIYPEWLGGDDFCQVHGCRFPYIVGEMANGIATADMVIAAVKAGFIGFFGAAGLVPDVVEKNILKIRSQLNGETTAWGSNLIHSPNEPSIEEGIVNLYINQHVDRVSASAYMNLSPHVVYYAAKGLHINANNQIQRKHWVLAKISRPEVAEHFMRPPPESMLQKLLAEGKLTPTEVELAAKIPVAEDLTVEADSGGHTDNRPMTALYPTIKELAIKIQKEYGFSNLFRIGVGGGIGTPSAVAAAFTLGADYILTGTINQAAVESGLAPIGREMLAKADIADVIMAPAADMFELGVKLQVLKRGTLFATRAQKLYELYSNYRSMAEIPAKEREKIERDLFRQPLEKVWETTKEYFKARDPKQVEKAEVDQHYRMALVFRWYLGFSSRWAIVGEEDRKIDYQIWCGPAMGAFNRWVTGSFLEALGNRTVEQIGKNLLEGAAYINRIQAIKNMGIHVPSWMYHFEPILLN